MSIGGRQKKRGQNEHCGAGVKKVVHKKQKHIEHEKELKRGHIRKCIVETLWSSSVDQSIQDLGGH